MTCPDCNHALHEPSKCGYCNCGESEISQSTALQSDIVTIVERQNFMHGEVSVREVKRIKPRRT